MSFSTARPVEPCLDDTCAAVSANDLVIKHRTCGSSVSWRTMTPVSLSSTQRARGSFAQWTTRRSRLLSNSAAGAVLCRVLLGHNACRAEPMSDYIDLLDKVTALQDLLVARATGQGADERAYIPLRAHLLKDPLVGTLLPRFGRTSRDLGQFWQFIQPKFAHYGERRQFIWDAFRPVLEAAGERHESGCRHRERSPQAAQLGSGARCVASRPSSPDTDDPEGAITLARSLLESVGGQTHPRRCRATGVPT